MTDYLMNHTAFSNLAGLFSPDAKYLGYKPNVKEIADDSAERAIDQLKRVLHVALKYNPPAWARRYLADAHFEACCVARRLDMPALYMPDVENATLRVLEYPVGAGTVPHIDFNLFTIVCWRSEPTGLVRVDEGPEDEDGDIESTTGRNSLLDYYSPGLHIGEIGEWLGLGPATRHEVPPVEKPQQSIVYFASPRMDAPLPHGPITFPAIEGFPEFTAFTTGQWQIERTARSRVVYT